MNRFYFLILILFFGLSCSTTKQITKESKESDNIGYLKLNIIDSVNDEIFSTSKVEIRGVKKLPAYDDKDKPFEKENDFEIRGTIKDNSKSLLAVEEGDYYVYLHVSDPIIRPLLITDLTSKTFQFGYRPKLEETKKAMYALQPYTNKNCHNSKMHSDPTQCAPLRIEKNKITEITLTFEHESSFNLFLTEAIWIMTMLTPIPLIGGPMIVIGTIIVTRDVEVQTTHKE